MAVDLTGKKIKAGDVVAYAANDMLYRAVVEDFGIFNYSGEACIHTVLLPTNKSVALLPYEVILTGETFEQACVAHCKAGQAYFRN